MKLLPSRAQRRGLSGFTLLEVLVVMALLSVVMLALGAALRTIGQSSERVDQRLLRADEFRVAVSFIRSTMERVSIRKIAPPAQAGASTVLFKAAPDAVEWVGIMPARYGAGGRYFFRLGLESSGQEAALVMRFLPWTDVQTFPDWAQAESRVLASSVVSFVVRYENARETPATWTTDWTIADRLPDHVSLSIHTAAGPWPALIVPLRVAPSGDSMGGFTIGGRV